MSARREETILVHEEKITV